MKKIIPVFLLLILILGCQKDAELNDVFTMSNPDEVEMISPPPPSQPGDNMKVYRSEGESAWLFWDAKKERIAVVGGDIESDCNGVPYFDLVDYQSIIMEEEDGEPRIISLVKANGALINIWDVSGAGDFWGVLCDFVTNTTPIYSGTCNFIYHNNDDLPNDPVPSPIDDGNNANALGLNIHSDGAHVLFQARWDGYDFATWKIKVKIDVK